MRKLPQNYRREPMHRVVGYSGDMEIGESSFGLAFNERMQKGALENAIKYHVVAEYLDARASSKNPIMFDVNWYAFPHDAADRLPREGRSDQASA